MNSIPALFETLDRNGDGLVSRSDLHRAARDLRWGWPQAPLFAVLDRLTLDAGLSCTDLIEVFDDMSHDLRGPYGRVLCRTSHSPPTDAAARPPAAPLAPVEGTDGMASLLDDVAGSEAADHFRHLLRELQEVPGGLDVKTSAWLFIDPQRSFTRGAWLQSLGPGGEDEVRPIRHAFETVARRLQALPAGATFAFSRCPFPPSSYDWDPVIQAVLPKDQRYFVKPGNDILWPSTNGCALWIEACLRRGMRTLIIGGCTLNSCVRISAQSIQTRFGAAGLQVIVDLSLCGARRTNYLPSPTYSGRSSIGSAIAEMTRAGVCVVPSLAPC